MKSRIAALVTLVFSVALLAGSALAATEKCPAGSAKIEAGPWQYCSNDGYITSICIKVGTQTISFTADARLPGRFTG